MANSRVMLSVNSLVSYAAAVLAAGSGTVLFTRGDGSYHLMAFADAEKTDIRRFCGYPAYGAANSGIPELAVLSGLRAAGIPHEQPV